MASPNYKKVLLKSWENISDVCKSSLERPDIARCQKVTTGEDLEAYLVRYTVPASDSSKSSMLQFPTIVGDYRSLAEDFSSSATQPDVSILWGLLSIMFSAFPDLPSSVSEAIVRMLKITGEKISSFSEKYRLLPSSDVVESACLDVISEVVQFLTTAINFCRQTKRKNMSSSSLVTVQQAHTERLEGITTAINRLNDVRLRSQPSSTYAPVAHLPSTYKLEQLAIQGSREPALVRCHAVPPHNPRFFGRRDILRLMADYLLPTQQGQEHRSLAIWGLGGVGKTEVALAYAHEYRADYDVILWLRSEKAEALRQSFTEAALQVLPSQASQSDYTANRLLLLNWLQETRSRWLLIFDNAERKDFLRNYWPATKQGTILATTRNHTLSLWPATSGIELGPFTTNEGADFLLRIIKTQSLLRAGATEDEESAAKDLSARVGGHALALNQMSALVCSRQWSIQELLKHYKKSPMTIHRLKRDGGHNGIYGLYLDTVFNEAFTAIEDTSAAKLLAILTHLAPDEIPQSLFVVANFQELPDALQFCEDELSLDEALEPLLALALVRKQSANEYKRNFSLHRLVQKEFAFFLSDVQRQEAFDHASTLLFRAFPQQVKGRPLHLQWPKCQEYIQHALILLETYGRKRELSVLRPNKDMCRLLSNCAWYLSEIGAMDELEALLEVAFSACRETGIPASDPLLYAHLCNTAGVLYHHTGRFANSLEKYEECHMLREKHLASDDEDLGIVYNNLGNVNESLNKPAESLEWHLKAVSLRGRLGAASREAVALSNSNIGRILGILNRDQEALEKLNAASAVLRNTGGWYHEAHVHFSIGTLYWRRRNYAVAKEKFLQSIGLMEDSGRAPLHATTAACYYKLGRIAAMENEPGIAVQYLEKCLVICNSRSQCKGERARVLYHLSNITSPETRNDKARAAMKSEAEELFQKMRPNESTKAINADDYDMIVTGLVR